MLEKSAGERRPERCCVVLGAPPQETERGSPKRSDNNNGIKNLQLLEVWNLRN